LRPSSGFEVGGRWLSSHKGELLVPEELSSRPWARVRWESRSCSGSLGLGRMRGVGVRCLVLPPDGATLSGNLDNAKGLRNGVR